jgi:tetratricopeptide (TPR) repeat protein
MLELATQSYAQALSIKPDDYWAWYQQGTVWQQLEQLTQAIKCYEEALKIDVEADFIWYRNACCYARLNNINWAITSLEKAIDLEPEKYLKLAIEASIWQEFRKLVGFQALITNKSRKYQLELG